MIEAPVSTPTEQPSEAGTDPDAAVQALLCLASFRRLWGVKHSMEHCRRGTGPQCGTGVETDHLSPCQFATTAAIGGRTAAAADITTAAVVE